MADRYVTPEDVAADLGMTYGGGEGDKDTQIEDACDTASRAVDRWCGRQFSTLDEETRRFDGAAAVDGKLWLHRIDIRTATTVAVDTSGLGSWHDLAGADWELGPFNAAIDGEPYRWIRRLRGRWPGGSDTVQIEGNFGWATRPSDVQLATQILAVQLYKRRVEAHFGVVQAPTTDAGLQRVIANDGQIKQLLQDFRRGRL